MSNSNDFKKLNKAVCASCIHFVEEHSITGNSKKIFPFNQNKLVIFADMCNQGGFTKNPKSTKNEKGDCKGFSPRREPGQQMPVTQRYALLAKATVR